MDLNLALSYQEQNDNLAIILTDTTTNYNDKDLVATTSVVANQSYEIANAGTYNFVGLGAANNNVGTRFISNATTTINLSGTVYPITPKVTDITGATLDVVYKNSSNVSITVPQINLYTQFSGPFADQEEMVYTITNALLGLSSSAQLVDGLYTLQYNVLRRIGGVGATRTDTLIVTILVYGQVKVATYQKLRQIPSQYLCNTGQVKQQISEADLCGAYLTGIENSAYIAKTEELLSMLTTLENILTNGSNITW